MERSPSASRLLPNSPALAAEEAEAAEANDVHVVGGAFDDNTNTDSSLLDYGRTMNDELLLDGTLATAASAAAADDEDEYKPTTNSGLEVIENHDAPLPFSQKMSASLFPMLELIKEGHSAPVPATQSVIVSYSKKAKSLEVIEAEAPSPVTQTPSSSHETIDYDKSGEKLPNDRERNAITPSAFIANADRHVAPVPSVQQNSLPSLAPDPVDEPNSTNNGQGDIIVTIDSAQSLNVPLQSGDIQNTQLLEATMVDDMIYYHATPLRPRWQSKRFKYYVIVGLVSAIIVAIAAYFSSKRKNKSNGDINQQIMIPAPTSSNFTWKEYGETITADVSHLGASVAFSDDGSILAIGAPGYTSDGVDGAGHVKLYRFHNGSSWEQIGQDIKGNRTGDWFGSSLDLSADGKTLAIGAPARMFEEKDGMPGYVRVYSINEGDDASISWTSIGQIVGDAPADYFGGSVSVSADGTTLAVGGYGNDGNGSNSGHTRLYQISGSGLTQLGDDINGEAIEDSTGFDVSLSADGRTVAISSPWNSGIGKVMIFSFDSTESSWKQVGKDIFGDLLNDCFGWSVALSADGQTVGVGAPAEGMTDDPGGGYVRVYHFEDDDWQKIGNDISGDKFGGAFGGELSISDDGKTIAIGNYHGDGKALGSGYVKVYRINDYESDWEQFGKTIEGETSFGGFGSSISFTADGRTVAIGSPFSNYKGGNVRVFSIAN